MYGCNLYIDLYSTYSQDSNIIKFKSESACKASQTSSFEA